MKILKYLLYSFFLLFVFNSYSQNINHLGIDNFPVQIVPRPIDEPPYTVTRNDFTITMRDGVIIDAVKFIPQATIPAGGWPTVIMVHGYGSDKEYLAGFCNAQAEYGYYTMTFSVRGHGNSGGLSNLISRTEALDFIEIVNWVKRDSLNGSNPGNILVMGGSQGGLIPFMASSMGQTTVGKLNVKTIISALAPPDFASNWIENGCIKMSFLWTVNYTPDIVRYNSQAGRLASWVFANNKAKWDSLAYWLPRDRDFMNIVQNNTTPILMEGSWQDKFFNASGIIKAAGKLNSPFRMYLGAVQGHGGDASPTEDIWHMNFYNDWYFYWLFGMQNGTLNAAKYQYASTSYPVVNDYFTFSHDSSNVWPPANTTNWRLFFGRNNKLKTTPTILPSAVKLENHVTGGLTMQEAVNEEFKGSVFNSKFTKDEVVFETDPLTEDKKMVGTPKINLQYLATKGPFCQYNFQIFEVKPDGTQRLVTRVNYTDRDYFPYLLRFVNIKGQAHSHIFKAGDKIRVTLTNLDATPYDNQYLLDGNPFVLPVLSNSDNYMLIDLFSYLDIPIVPAESDITVGNVNINQPYSFELKQNYPNPFNPVTTIEYQIAQANKVEIKVYDLLGKEVRTLVNEYQEAGSHSILFNASDLSSGVYFYKITAGNFNSVKRMVLVK